MSHSRKYAIEIREGKAYLIDQSVDPSTREVDCEIKNEKLKDALLADVGASIAEEAKGSDLSTLASDAFREAILFNDQSYSGEKTETALQQFVEQLLPPAEGMSAYATSKKNYQQLLKSCFTTAINKVFQDHGLALENMDKSGASHDNVSLLPTICVENGELVVKSTYSDIRVIKTDRAGDKEPFRIQIPGSIVHRYSLATGKQLSVEFSNSFLKDLCTEKDLIDVLSKGIKDSDTDEIKECKQKLLRVFKNELALERLKKVAGEAREESDRSLLNNIHTSIKALYDLCDLPSKNTVIKIVDLIIEIQSLEINEPYRNEALLDLEILVKTFINNSPELYQWLTKFIMNASGYTKCHEDIMTILHDAGQNRERSYDDNWKRTLFNRIYPFIEKLNEVNKGKFVPIIALKNILFSLKADLRDIYDCEKRDDIADKIFKQIKIYKKNKLVKLDVPSFTRAEYQTLATTASVGPTREYILEHINGLLDPSNFEDYLSLTVANSAGEAGNISDRIKSNVKECSRSNRASRTIFDDLPTNPFSLIFESSITEVTNTSNKTIHQEDFDAWCYFAVLSTLNTVYDKKGEPCKWVTALEGNIGSQYIASAYFNSFIWQPAADILFREFKIGEGTSKPSAYKHIEKAAGAIARDLQMIEVDAKHINLKKREIAKKLSKLKHKVRSPKLKTAINESMLRSHENTQPVSAKHSNNMKAFAKKVCSMVAKEEGPYRKALFDLKHLIGMERGLHPAIYSLYERLLDRITEYKRSDRYGFTSISDLIELIDATKKLLQRGNERDLNEADNTYKHLLPKLKAAGADELCLAITQIIPLYKLISNLNGETEKLIKSQRMLNEIANYPTADRNVVLETIYYISSVIEKINKISKGKIRKYSDVNYTDIENSVKQLTLLVQKMNSSLYENNPLSTVEINFEFLIKQGYVDVITSYSYAVDLIAKLTPARPTPYQNLRDKFVTREKDAKKVNNAWSSYDSAIRSLANNVKSFAYQEELTALSATVVNTAYACFNELDSNFLISADTYVEIINKCTGLINDCLTKPWQDALNDNSFDSFLNTLKSAKTDNEKNLTAAISQLKNFMSKEATNISAFTDIKADNVDFGNAYDAYLTKVGELTSGEVRTEALNILKVIRQQSLDSSRAISLKDLTYTLTRTTNFLEEAYVKSTNHPSKKMVEARSFKAYADSLYKSPLLRQIGLALLSLLGKVCPSAKRCHATLFNDPIGKQLRIAKEVKKLAKLASKDIFNPPKQNNPAAPQAPSLDPQAQATITRPKA